MPPHRRGQDFPAVSAGFSEPSASPEAPRADDAAPKQISQPTNARIEPLSAERFLLKVTVGRELKDAIELARDLLRHRNPGGELENVLDLAVRDLIERLERERLAKTKHPVTKARPARRARITNETKRAVVSRDGVRCAWVGSDGHRCNSTAFLEFDHVTPKGTGGSGASDNARLLCRAHNQRAAERVYGRAHMQAASRSRARDGKR